MTSLQIHTGPAYEGTPEIEGAAVYTWNGLQHLVDEGYEVSGAPDIWEPLYRGWVICAEVNSLDADRERYYLVRPKAPEPITVEFDPREIEAFFRRLTDAYSRTGWPEPIQAIYEKLQAALDAAKES